MQVAAVDAVSVSGRFEAPSTRPITNAPVPPVETTWIRLGTASAAVYSTISRGAFRSDCSLL